MKKKISLSNGHAQPKTQSPMLQESKKIPFESLHPVELIKRSQKNQFGNRPDYYERRGTDLKGLDSRVLSLGQDCFRGKKVLDVGCHSGILTLQIAKHYKPAYIKGIDIDYRLINEAVKHWSLEEALVKLESDKAVLESKLEPFKFIPKSIRDSSKEIGFLLGKRNQENKKVIEEETEESNYPHNTSFEVANILELDENREKSKYDTIICFSLTKWIHLNFGDEGIKKLFQKLKMALVKGGILLLEVQNFKSYSKRAKEFDRFKETFPKIELKPADFDVYLKELGFEKVTNIETKNIDEFKRDIEIYRLASSN